MTEQQTEYNVETKDALEMLGVGYEGKPKTIFRVEKNADNPFVMMDRRPLEKPYLSWKAKGLLAYLLSRPDNWTVNFGDLVKRSTDGEHATRGAAKELEQAGHLEVKRVTDDKGRVIRYEYIVYERPVCDFPQVDNPNVDNPDVENRHINDNKYNDKDNNESVEEGDKTQTVFSLYQSEIGVLTPMIAQSLQDDEQEHGLVWVCEAIKIASMRGARNYKYIQAILKRWKAGGYGSPHPKAGQNDGSFDAELKKKGYA